MCFESENQGKKPERRNCYLFIFGILMLRKYTKYNLKHWNIDKARQKKPLNMPARCMAPSLCPLAHRLNVTSIIIFELGLLAFRMIQKQYAGGFINIQFAFGNPLDITRSFFLFKARVSFLHLMSFVHRIDDCYCLSSRVWALIFNYLTNKSWNWLSSLEWIHIEHKALRRSCMVSYSRCSCLLNLLPIATAYQRKISNYSIEILWLLIPVCFLPQFVSSSVVFFFHLLFFLSSQLSVCHSCLQSIMAGIVDLYSFEIAF